MSPRRSRPLQTPLAELPGLEARLCGIEGVIKVPLNTIEAMDRTTSSRGPLAVKTALHDQGRSVKVCAIDTGPGISKNFSVPMVARELHRSPMPCTRAGTTMEDEPTVFVVDDDSAMRASMNVLLESASLLHAAYSSAEAFLAQYEPDMPGCLVLDLFMPEMSGIQMIEQLRARHWLLPVIVITGHGTIAQAVEATPSLPEGQVRPAI